MAVAKLLTSAFDLRVSENDGLTYLTVSGLNNLVMTEEPTDIDITTFDNEGWSSMMPGIKSGMVEAAGFRLADSVTGARDAGQKAVEKAARQNGYAGRRRYRVVWKDDTNQYIDFYGYAKNGQFGGGLNEAAPWSVSVIFDGAPTFSGALFNPEV
jgi:predicted secreted protein